MISTGCFERTHVFLSIPHAQNNHQNVLCARPLSSLKSSTRWTRPVPVASTLRPVLNSVQIISLSARGLAFAISFTHVRELSRFAFVSFRSLCVSRKMLHSSRCQHHRISMLILHSFHAFSQQTNIPNFVSIPASLSTFMGSPRVTRWRARPCLLNLHRGILLLLVRLLHLVLGFAPTLRSHTLVGLRRCHLRCLWPDHQVLHVSCHVSGQGSMSFSRYLLCHNSSTTLKASPSTSPPIIALALSNAGVFHFSEQHVVTS